MLLLLPMLAQAHRSFPFSKLVLHPGHCSRQQVKQLYYITPSKTLSAFVVHVSLFGCTHWKLGIAYTISISPGRYPVNAIIFSYLQKILEESFRSRKMVKASQVPRHGFINKSKIICIRQKKHFCIADIGITQ
jgi:hypothetical protein